MILQGYLFREISYTCLAVFILLVLIYVSSNLVEYLSQAAAGKIVSDLIFAMLALKLFTELGLILPLCLYLGVYLALSRMQQDNETMAMMGFGLGTGFFIQAVFKLAMGLALVIALLALYVIPWAQGRLSALETQAKEQSNITGISAGRFKEFNEADRVIYAEEISKDQNSMRNIFLQARENGKLWVLTSDEAYLQTDKKTEARYVVFSAGRRYTGTPGQLDYTIIEYERYGIRIDNRDNGSGMQSMHATPTPELWKAADAASAAELQWRVSMPIAAVLLALLAVALASPGCYWGRHKGLLTSILIYFTYSNLLGIARTLVKQGELPVSVGLWWVHALILALIIGLLFYPSCKRWRASRLTQ